MWWGWRGMGAIGCHETGCMNPPSPLKPPSPPNLTGVDCISYLFFSCLLLISNHFQNQGGKISRNCSSHDFPLLGGLHLAEIRFKGGKRVFEADKCFVCVSHWSFLPSLGDRRHNVEWSGGTAAPHRREKSKQCNLCGNATSQARATWRPMWREREELFPSVFCPRRGWQLWHIVKC